MKKKETKTMSEIHAGEVFTDNSKISYCEQCKDCKFWGNDKDDYFSNDYEKGNCDKYPFSEGVTKPDGIINNYASCTYKEKR